MDDALRRRLASLGLRESDLEETFARSSGPGGQHVNKVSTAVTLRHRPSQLSVTVQDSRSQSRNRQLALLRLIELSEARERERRLAAAAAAGQQRRRNSPRPRALKRRILESKRERAQTKKLRGRVGES